LKQDPVRKVGGSRLGRKEESDFIFFTDKREARPNSVPERGRVELREVSS